MWLSRILRNSSSTLNRIPTRCVSGIPTDSSTAEKASAIRFDDTQLAYRSKTTWELVRALAILTFCKYEFLVDRSDKLIAFGRKLLGRQLFNRLMRMTFYKQFVAGEDDAEIESLIARLKKYGPSIILNFAVEDDEQGSEQKSSGIMIQTTTTTDPGDNNLQSFLKTIDTVAAVTGGAGFTAIKVTALTRPETLIALTDAIKSSRLFVNHILDRDTRLSTTSINVEKELLITKLAAKGYLPDDITTQRWLRGLEERDDGRIVDSINWSSVVTQRLSLDDLFHLPTHSADSRNSSLVALTDRTRESYFKLVDRLKKIAEHAERRKIRVLVDAEQSYFQPAIARLSLELMRTFNKDFAVIYNTYQTYLQDAFMNMSPDLEMSRRENFQFGAKVVRGAYINQERERAVTLKYPCPVNPDFDATSRMYEKVVGTILEDISKADRQSPANMIIAGHNEGTVRWAVDRIQSLKIPKKTRQVYFGQLLGMSDHLSFTLADSGFNVVKCVPYGPVEMVLPYLVRRAQENRGFMEKTTTERRLLGKEIYRRAIRGQILHDPNQDIFTPLEKSPA